MGAMKEVSWSTLFLTSGRKRHRSLNKVAENNVAEIMESTIYRLHTVYLDPRTTMPTRKLMQTSGYFIVTRNESGTIR